MAASHIRRGGLFSVADPIRQARDPARLELPRRAHSRPPICLLRARSNGSDCCCKGRPPSQAKPVRLANRLMQSLGAKSTRTFRAELRSQQRSDKTHWRLLLALQPSNPAHKARLELSLAQKCFARTPMMLSNAARLSNRTQCAHPIQLAHEKLPSHLPQSQQARSRTNKTGSREGSCDSACLRVSPPRWSGKLFKSFSPILLRNRQVRLP